MVTRNSLVTNLDDKHHFLARLFTRWTRIGGSVEEITKTVHIELLRDRATP